MMIHIYIVLAIGCMAFFTGIVLCKVVRVGREMPGWKLKMQDKGLSGYKDLVAIPMCAKEQNLDGVRATFMFVETDDGIYEWRRVQCVEC